jgi:Na+/H+-dicarboxylate symporter
MNTAGYPTEPLGYGLENQEIVARFPAVARNAFVLQSINLQNYIVMLVWYMVLLKHSQVSTWQYSRPVQPPMYVVRATSTKFGLHAGNVKFSTQH